MSVITEIRAYDVEFAIAFEFSINRSSKTAKWNVKTGLPWDSNDPASIKFASELDQAFNRRGKTYTHLSPGSNINNSLAHKLKEFKSKKTPQKADFSHAMSTFISHHLKGELNKSQLQTGFMVTAILYQSYTSKNGAKVAGTEKNILNISMIRTSEALQFDSDYRVIKVPAIDLSQLLQSARIDVDIFTDNLKKNQVDVDSDMSFIAGTGNVRDYFFDGLGASNYVKSKVAGDNLLAGVDSFLTSTGLPRIEKLKIKDSLHSYISSSKNKEGVHIDDVQSHLDSLLPASHAQFKGEFIQHLTDNNLPVNDFISFTPDQKNSLIWVNLTIKDVQMKFRLEDIGKQGSNSTLRYNSTTDTLSFEEKVTDPDVKAEIKRALKG